MKKINYILFFTLFIGINSYAQSIPDPMVDIVSPPKGLPSPNVAGMNAPVVEINPLNFQGVMIFDEKKKDSKNKVFFNNKSYSIGDIINDSYQVKSVSRTKVIIVDTQTKQNKTFNVIGE